MVKLRDLGTEVLAKKQWMLDCFVVAGCKCYFLVFSPPVVVINP